MFVQLIFGKVADPEALRRQWDDWHQRLAPGADGWLGATAGMTPAGDFAAAVRFQSAQAARRNSERPEQGAWWAATAPSLAGEVDFLDSDDVTVLESGSDEAGFAQMMRARCRDRQRFEAVEAEIGDLFRRHRPDFIGGMRVWTPTGAVTAVDWFTTEAEARAAEGKAFPDRLETGFGEWMSLLEDVRWYDLPNPWLSGPG